MTQSIIVDPGDSRQASFRLANPSSSTGDTFYKISVEPFYSSENGGRIFSAVGDSGEMVNWITFDVPEEGRLEPNETREIVFTISVPEVAPAGGQYASIIVTTSNGVTEEDLEGVGDAPQASIKEVKRMAHLVYAEITGDVIRKGTIDDVNVPGFLFSGKISGASTVSNEGNVHSVATYKMKVYPLFSDEELYSNEENPDVNIVLPNRSVYNSIAWDDTPSIGIFNVVYTVEFDEARAEVTKMVIICPIWLLFLIVFVILVIIMFLVIKVKHPKKNTEKVEE